MTTPRAKARASERERLEQVLRRALRRWYWDEMASGRSGDADCIPALARAVLRDRQRPRKR